VALVNGFVAPVNDSDFLYIDHAHADHSRTCRSLLFLFCLGYSLVGFCPQRVQLASLFQTLRDGRPMIEYESRFKIYDFLTVPDLPRVHWSEGAGWLMAEHMYDIVKKKHRRMLAAASYMSLTTDETMAVDNCSYIAVHCYVLQDWIRFPILLHLQKMESGNFSMFL
jgi:hypothetical protein